MASGIVSIHLHSDHRAVLSAITLWFGAGVWVLLAGLLAARWAYHRDRFDREARSPGAFTGAASTAVLGTRLAAEDYHAAAAALLAVSAVCWAVLVVPVLRHWQTPTAGISFVLTAATESLAVLGAALAVSYSSAWLLSAAAVALVLGLAFYVITAARFEFRDLVTGHGDHWIAGGALGICALAAGHVTQAAAALGQLTGLHQVLETGTLVLWGLAMVWLLPWWCARSSGRDRATTRAAGRPSFRSAFTPRAASSPARSPASPRSPTSPKSGRGSRSPAGCSHSPG